MKQQVELGIERDRLLPGTMRGVILVQPLLQIALAAGLGNPLCCLVCLVDGGLGFALQSMPHLEEVAQLVEIIRHPPGHVPGGLGASHASLAAI